MTVRRLLQMWRSSADGKSDLLLLGAPGLRGKARFLRSELDRLAGPPRKAITHAVLYENSQGPFSYPSNNLCCVYLTIFQ